jgi:alpha-1,6-mannosyltransferase
MPQHIGRAFRPEEPSKSSDRSHPGGIGDACIRLYLRGLLQSGAVQASTTRNAAIAASIASVVLVAIVASVPRSPFQPVLPGSAEAAGPFRWLAELTALDGVHGSALVAVSVITVALAAAAFLAVLREAWRGTISPRTVIGLAVAYHVVVLFLPLLFSRDVYSYAYYGRIAAVYHANPYVTTPSDFPSDPLAQYVGPRWVDTPAVYGPLFTLLSSGVARIFGSVAASIAAFRAIAIAASLATIAVLAPLVRRVRPDREAFAVAIIGLNPVVLFQSVASGHNDLLVALSIAGALALVFAGKELPATAVLSLGAMVKATAAVPLLLLVVAVAARTEPGRRARALAAHLGVAAGIALLFALPFLQSSDPTLGMAELARHQGWLAPSRFFGRVLDAMTGEALGIVARMAFAIAFVLALFLIARALVRRAPSIPAEAQGAAWGWSLLFLMLLGPVLLPWYLAWTLPLAWLLPKAPRLTVVWIGTLLTVSQWATEPTRYPRAYDANVLVGHYVLTPLAVAVLAWVVLDFVRRLRVGTPLEEEADEVAAPAPQR